MFVKGDCLMFVKHDHQMFVKCDYQLFQSTKKKKKKIKLLACW